MNLPHLKRLHQLTIRAQAHRGHLKWRSILTSALVSNKESTLEIMLKSMAQITCTYQGTFYCSTLMIRIYKCMSRFPSRVTCRHKLLLTATAAFKRRLTPRDTPRQRSLETRAPCKIPSLRSRERRRVAKRNRETTIWAPRGIPHARDSRARSCCESSGEYLCLFYTSFLLLRRFVCKISNAIAQLPTQLVSDIIVERVSGGAHYYIINRWLGDLLI